MTKKVTALSNMLIKEVSLCGKGANQEAQILICKKDDPDSFVDADSLRTSVQKCVEEALVKSVHSADFEGELKSIMRERLLFDVSDVAYDLFDALRTSTYTAIENMDGEELESQLQQNAQDFVDRLVAAIGSAEEQVGLTKSIVSRIKKMFSENSTGEDEMTEDLKKTAEDQARTIKELGEKIEKMEADQAIMQKVAAAAGDDAKHMDECSMDLEQRKAFMAKSDDERRKIIMEKRGEVDPGSLPESVRKALEDSKVQNEQLQKQLDEIRGASRQAEFRKVAETDLSHLPGSLDERTEVVKALHDLEQAPRDKIMEILKVADKIASENFFEKGGNVTPEANSAADRLDNLAKTYAEKNGCTAEVAFTKVLETDEGRRLYNESIN